MQMRRHRNHTSLPVIAYLRVIFVGVRPGVLHIGRHQFHPPLHHAVALGKKSVASDIHPVAFVLDRPRDPADLLASLQKNRFNIGPPKQLKPSRQPCRSGPDDHCSFAHRKKSTPEKTSLSQYTYGLSPQRNSPLEEISVKRTRAMSVIIAPLRLRSPNPPAP